MKQTSIKQIARQRIQILFEEAKNIAKTDPKMASKYVKTARRIAMAAKIRLPLEFRRQTCKNCNALLSHGINCRVRVKQKRESHVVVTCLNCGNQIRILLTKKMEQKSIDQNNDPNEAAC